MNIVFTMDALDASGSKAWRLQNDMQHWRPCTYAEPLQAQDAALPSPADAGKLNGRRMQRDKELGLVALDKPGMFDFLMRGIFAHTVLHRFSAAPLPDKQQLIATVAALDPGTPWLLYLDPAGHFRALDTSCEGIIGNLKIAVRGEIASAAGYIGEEAAANSALMDISYRQFLAGWLQHLRSGQMAVFVPDIEKLKQESDYLALIGDWKHE